MLVFLRLVFLLLELLLGLQVQVLQVRVQLNQVKAQLKQIELQVATEVTNAGIHGVISNVKEKTVIVKIADNVKVEFDRAAIVTIESSSSSESAA